MQRPRARPKRWGRQVCQQLQYHQRLNSPRQLHVRLRLLHPLRAVQNQLGDFQPPATSSQQSQNTPASVASTTIQTPQTTNKSRTAPPSPTINGTVSASVSDSVASPMLSGETASSTAVATSSVTKEDEQDDSSCRPHQRKGKRSPPLSGK